MLLQHQIADWEAWQARRSERYALPLDLPDSLRRQFQVSAMVLRTHLDKTYPGAMVASLRPASASPTNAPSLHCCVTLI